MTVKATTSELIDAIAGDTGYPKKEVENILKALSGTVTFFLKNGKAVPIAQLGTFKPTHREARMGRNPKTGEALQIAASNGASFAAAKGLKEALNT